MGTIVLNRKPFIVDPDDMAGSRARFDAELTQLLAGGHALLVGPVAEQEMLPKSQAARFDGIGAVLEDDRMLVATMAPLIGG